MIWLLSVTAIIHHLRIEGAISPAETERLLARTRRLTGLSFSEDVVVDAIFNWCGDDVRRHVQRFRRSPRHKEVVMSSRLTKRKVLALLRSKLSGDDLAIIEHSLKPYGQDAPLAIETILRLVPEQLPHVLDLILDHDWTSAALLETAARERRRLRQPVPNGS